MHITLLVFMIRGYKTKSSVVIQLYQLFVRFLETWTWFPILKMTTKIVFQYFIIHKRYMRYTRYGLPCVEGKREARFITNLIWPDWLECICCLVLITHQIKFEHIYLKLPWWVRYRERNIIAKFLDLLSIMSCEIHGPSNLSNNDFFFFFFFFLGGGNLSNINRCRKTIEIGIHSSFISFSKCTTT